ncbi:hypothetical protein AHMF7605_00125 [Adhaeribacter arboris]|uniref:Secretion system C-terminal sorting domain-containing protein n=1 Tax=Adhaeribacter arboris TaxID=2072846 RepID=A0A2T2Y948_9BACT|nr:T9SS type A sorting domain-containing protein [Adhaeribacter arboris]PSR52035.1 hypothetical protein AHMF7605_00125 [Adhaeribacter arboris]
MKKVILLISAWLICFYGVAQNRLFENGTLDKPFVSGFNTQNIVPEASLYPNPSTGKVFISLSGFKGKRMQLRVTNVIGNVVFQETYYETEDQTIKALNLSNVNKGLYYVKIEAEKYNEIRKVYLI